jgi:hypothetical protein
MTENIVAITTEFKDDLVLAEHASEIRRLGKRVKEDIVEIGRHLVEAREHAGHGAWLVWIDVEFGWADQTAYRFIHLYEARQTIPEFHKLWNSDLPVSALYQLAAPNTPDEARTEVVERVEAGEQPTCAMVTEVIAKAKGKTTESADDAEIHDIDAVDEDPSIEQRRAEHAALFADHEWESADSTEVNNVKNSAVEDAESDAEFLFDVWTESTPKDQQFIRDLVLEEYFAQASGADIFARIPAAKLDEVIPAFLDKLTVEGVRTRMSEAFGQSLRRKLAAPGKAKKSARQWTKSINHRSANSTRNGRGIHSRQ